VYDLIPYSTNVREEDVVDSIGYVDKIHKFDAGGVDLGITSHLRYLVSDWLDYRF